MMLTPRTNSLIATWPLPSQSPTQEGGVLVGEGEEVDVVVFVGNGVKVGVPLGVSVEVVLFVGVAVGVSVAALVAV